MKTTKRLQRSETKSIVEIAINQCTMGKLRISLYLAFLFAISLITLNSCNEKKKSPEEQLKGKWVVSNVELIVENYIDDTTEYVINLNSTNEGTQFTTNVFPVAENVKGNWIISNDTIWFEYVIPNFSNPADSVNISTDAEGNPKVSMYFWNNELATISDGVIEIPSVRHAGKVVSKSGDNLIIYLDQVGTFHLEREVVHQGGFSAISILRGVVGMAFLLGIAWLFSSDRKSIDWALVGKGITLQVIIALLVLKVPGVDLVFMWISEKFVSLIKFTNYGVDFLFGQMGIGEVQAPLITFAIKVLPTIIFFSALMSLLYYWGVLQKVVYAFAWLMKKFMRLSGAESLAAAGNVFLGQTESPLLVKPYLLGMTKSEIMCLMTGGMATIAGGVLAAYIGFLGGDDPAAQAFFAKHLLTASIISAPAAIIAAKILVPETEKINEDLKISKDKIGVNALEAITNGTTDGLKLAVNVGAMLLVFIALMALANGILGWVGDFGGINQWIAENTSYQQLSFQFLLGYACAPIVWMMGVDGADIVYVGELLGQKTILNEFVAYPRLGEMKDQGLINEKSIIMSTYMLCGFANIASIGIQIGGIGALIPSRKGLLSQLGIRALVGGTIACLLTAVVVGMTM